MTFNQYLRLSAKRWAELEDQYASQPAGDSFEKLLPFINTPADLAGASMLIEHFAVCSANPIEHSTTPTNKSGKRIEKIQSCR